MDKMKPVEMNEINRQYHLAFTPIQFQVAHGTKTGATTRCEERDVYFIQLGNTKETPNI